VAAELSPERVPTRTLAVAGGVTFLALALMAWDHLWGNEGGSQAGFPVDAPTFFLAGGLTVTAALVVFGFTVRRAGRRPSTLHVAALVHSALAVLLALPASWLGFPIVVAGGGIALGLGAAEGPHRRLAAFAVALGVFVLLFGVLATAFPTSDGD
jgi:hypothetical protein